MNDLMYKRTAENELGTTLAAGSCPLAEASNPMGSLKAEDELIFPQYKRVIAQYATTPMGLPELHLYYGDKEISFDDPELFAFGEGLTRQERFAAGSAIGWGQGYDWPQIRELLEMLIEEGILQRAGDGKATPLTVRNEPLPSPLPPAETSTPRTWFECQAITRALTGHAVEVGYLEAIVPVFRVAHMAVDADGRQVGEANVFPPHLRLDIPTEWRPCPHAGSRFQADRPMNVTALKAMRKHWPAIMALLLRIREAFLRRFPQVRHGWTVGDLERLSSLVLALPGYLLMRSPQGVENGQLHPVLSSMFRVTDGLRMTMHQMLFLPLAEPTLPPDMPMTSAETYAYAERNYVFFSTHGVCAGPKAMIEEFLGVLVDGQPAKGSEAIMFDPPIQAALDDLETALDYGLYGLQTYAVVFSLWPMMSRTYEQLWHILENWSGNYSATLDALRQRFDNHMEFQRTKSLLATEEWRVSRERAYADMYEHCVAGLGGTAPTASLAGRIAPVTSEQHRQVYSQLRQVLQQRFQATTPADAANIERLTTCVMDYFCREQGIVRAATEIQQVINRLLGRTPPQRPLTAADLDVYNQLQGEVTRLPYLTQELADCLGLDITVTAAAISIAERETPVRT